ncbi:MAG: polymer-forming cytoskeletal protein [Planctomycetes bacterium]|nr:polymer-forming cytoskeletal protein [Planctomycetota bacterium]
MQLFAPKAPLRRKIDCPLCEGKLEIGGRTQSIVCPHCNRSIDTSDHFIDYYCAKKLLETSGDVVVDKKGTLRGEVKAGRVVVKGKLYGVVRARVAVEVLAGGRLEGEIHAPLLHVEDGGALVGGCRAGAGVPPSRAAPSGVLR